ncbi:hypothetical protein T02_1205 [Trichinella nativa]|uniref:Uncharacterized protein n=1 Tax=Trichinella nativa TaxID=6335 RepID=A0A0V1L1R9_9BILA|nr:hypothetical protein T02_1205 [Trichinella nativa]
MGLNGPKVHINISALNGRHAHGYSCPTSRESSLKSYLVCANLVLALWRDMIYQSQAINEKGIPQFPNVEKFPAEPAPQRHQALQ